MLVILWRNLIHFWTLLCLYVISIMVINLLLSLYHLMLSITWKRSHTDTYSHLSTRKHIQSDAHTSILFDVSHNSSICNSGLVIVLCVLYCLHHGVLYSFIVEGNEKKRWNLGYLKMLGIGNLYVNTASAWQNDKLPWISIRFFSR